MLELQVLEVEAGRSLQREVGQQQQELLYVVSGMGALRLCDAEHPLEPDTAALLLPGETYAVEASDLKLVSVSAPAGARIERNCVIMRLADSPEQRADENRTFRVLYETDVTQFVGVVEPCRAPDHSHPYDEVGFILEGQGFARIAGKSSPIGPGSRFHLSPGEVHCIENSGPGQMRILGVFYPSGSPAQRS